MLIVPMDRGGGGFVDGVGLHRGRCPARPMPHRHAHAFHQVSLILSCPGDVEWRFEGPDFTGRPTAGDVVVCPAFTPTRVRCASPFESVSVRIATERLDRVAGLAGFGPGAGLSAALRRDRFAGEAVLKLADEAATGRDGGGLLAESLGTALAVHLLREYAGEGPPTSTGAALAHAGVRRAIDHIDAHLGGDLSVARLAAVAGLSRFHFIRRFREAAGTTPHRYVVDRRVDRARELLRSGMGPAQAAFAVGFSSQSHLHHHVRRLLGVTPGELARGRAPGPPRPR